MMSDDGMEAVVVRLSRLPTLAPDAARAERTRRRCRALLDQQSRRQPVRSRLEIPFGFKPVIVGTICVFCVVYVSALVATAFQLQGLIH